MLHDHPPHLAEELTLFHDVYRAHRNAVISNLTALGLQDVGQPKVLMLLSCVSEEGITQRELTQAVGVSPSTLSASLKSLESNGYITRSADAADGRLKRIRITQKGRDSVERVRTAFDRVDRQLYAGFTPEEVERIKGNYRRMLRNLSAVGGTPCPDAPRANPPGKEVGNEC